MEKTGYFILILLYFSFPQSAPAYATCGPGTPLPCPGFIAVSDLNECDDHLWAYLCATGMYQTQSTSVHVWDGGASCVHFVGAVGHPSTVMGCENDRVYWMWSSFWGSRFQETAIVDPFRAGTFPATEVEVCPGWRSSIKWRGPISYLFVISNDHETN